MTASASAAPSAATSTARAWTVVVVLSVIGTFNLADRFLPSALAELIKQDLSLSDTAIGLINGFGFLIVYASLGIPIARVSDRGAYGLVIGACVTLWSAMTLLGGLAQNGIQLALTRMGVAVGEAGSSPAAHAYISRNFPPDRRAAPLAVLILSVPLATSVGLMMAGLLGQWLGWRGAFFVMGGISLLTAIPIVMLMGLKQAPPVDTTQAAAPRGRVSELLRKRSYLLILAGASCVAISGYSFTTFAPAFFMRIHGMSVGEVGVEYGLVSGAIGIVGLLLTGFIADRLSTKDPRWLLWAIAVMILLAAPFTLVGFLAPGKWAAIICVATGYLVGTAYQAPMVAAMQRLAPPDMRATASAIFYFCSGILGGLGPLSTGMISDYLEPTHGQAVALQQALLVTPVIQAAAGVLFFLASLSFRREMIPDEQPSRPAGQIVE